MSTTQTASTTTPALDSAEWTRSSLGDDSTWTHSFIPEQVAEVARAIEQFEAFGAASSQRHFHALLPSLAPLFNIFALGLREGRGFVRLRALPLDALGAEKARVAFWVIGAVSAAPSIRLRRAA